MTLNSQIEAISIIFTEHMKTVEDLRQETAILIEGLEMQCKQYILKNKKMYNLENKQTLSSNGEKQRNSKRGKRISTKKKVEMNCSTQSSRKRRISTNSLHSNQSGLTELQATQLNSKPRVVLVKCQTEPLRLVGRKVRNQRRRTSPTYYFNDCEGGMRQCQISDELSKRNHRNDVLVRRSLDVFSIRDGELKRSMMEQLLDEPKVLLVKTTLPEGSPTVPSSSTINEKAVDGKEMSTDTSLTRINSKKEPDMEEKAEMHIPNHVDIIFENRKSPQSFTGVQKRLKCGRDGKENVGVDYTKLMKSMDMRPLGQRNSALEVGKKPLPCTPLKRIRSSELQQLRSAMRLKAEKAMKKRIEEESKRNEQRREDVKRKRQENLRAVQNEIRMKRETKMLKAADHRREAEKKKLAIIKEEVLKKKRKQLKLRRLNERQGKIDRELRKALNIEEDEDMVIGTDSEGRWTMASNYEMRNNMEPISPFTATEHGGSAFLAHDAYSVAKPWTQTDCGKRPHWSKKDMRKKLLSAQYKVSPHLIENYFVFHEKIAPSDLFGDL